MVAPLSWPAGATPRGRPDYSPGGRPNYWDRDPVVASIIYDASGVAPHAQTNRQTYGVPAGKVAYIEWAVARVIRAAAASAVGRVTARISVDDGTGNGLFVAEVLLSTNVGGDMQRAALAPGGLVPAQGTVTLTTIDQSTGGTIDYHLAAKIIEFRP